MESLFESRKDSPTITTFKPQSVLKSWIWQHFTKISEAKAECNYCKKSFVVSGTGTMSKHIHVKHSTKITHATQSTVFCKKIRTAIFVFKAIGGKTGLLHVLLTVSLICIEWAGRGWLG